MPETRICRIANKRKLAATSIDR